MLRAGEYDTNSFPDKVLALLKMSNFLTLIVSDIQKSASENR